MSEAPVLSDSGDRALLAHATWTGHPASENLPVSNRTIIVLAAVASFVWIFYRTNQTVLNVLFLIALMIALANLMRQRRTLHSLLRDIDTPLDANHFLVRIQLIREKQSLSWFDFGYMVIENGYIAYNSPAVSFLIGGQDLNQISGYRYHLTRKDVGSDAIVLELREHREVAIKVLACRHRRLPKSVRRSFLRTLAEFADQRPTTSEHRSLPPLEPPK